MLHTRSSYFSGEFFNRGFRSAYWSSRFELDRSGFDPVDHGRFLRGGSKHSTFYVSATFVDYGCSLVVGSIITSVNKNRGNICGEDANEVKKLGNDLSSLGYFGETLSVFDKAIAPTPGSAVVRSYRVATLTDLEIRGEVVKDCKVVVNNMSGAPSYTNVLNGSYDDDRCVPTSNSVALHFIQPSIIDGRVNVSPPLEVAKKGSVIWRSTLVGYFLGKKLPFQVVNSIGHNI